MMKGVMNNLRNSTFGKMFLNPKFAHYTWIGIFISVLNIFLLWLFIDIIGIHTIISSVLVVGGTFILRYILFDFFKIM